MDGKSGFDMMTKFMERHDRESKLDGIGWALFLIWVGIAWIAGVGLGAGLVGVAVITLGEQAIRRLLGLSTEIFWVVVGSGFAIGGFLELIDVDTPLAPVVLVVAGIALLVSVTCFGRKRSHQHPQEQEKKNETGLHMQPVITSEFNYLNEAASTVRDGELCTPSMPG